MTTVLQLKIQAAVAKVRGQESLLKILLTDALGWPVGEAQNVDDVSYSWSAEDLRASGLEQKVVDSRIWQVQPLAKGQPWGIFILQFKHPDAFTAGRGMTGVLRQVLRGLVAARTKSAALASWQREDLLFICTHAWQHYAFVHFAQPAEKGRAARLTSFGWSPDSPNRTLIQENLPHLEWPDDPEDAPAWREKWLRAFDKEKLSKEFFKEYERVFRNVEGLIDGIPNAERKRLFTQRLFNRLMFIAFIQKKGWLSFTGNTDYLSAFWNGYQEASGLKNSPPQMRRGGAPSDGVVLNRGLMGGDQQAKDKRRNFYADRLKRLFFHGLSTAGEVDIIGINRGGDLKATIGKVPYLNGGLFEQEEDDKDSKIQVPDEAIGAVLNELFNRFNFTVMESTPLDVEVAVDPEMLGKVFEELVTGRHETGSYYTPKPVVSFMCREALKGYLGSQLPSETPEAIERFVEEHNPEGLRNPEPVLEALRKVKVCDPACGSGAYLLGMLHELLDLRACLFATHKLDAISNFTRKLQIIQNNLYGVDLDVFAVNIARLRLWLSLAVEYEGDNPPPLPNLDFKIETGDSLTVAAPSDGLEQGFRKPLLDEYLKLKAEFLTAHHGHKIELRKRIAEIRATIHGWAHTGSAVDGFDWAVEFTEVFMDRGFDIVLANPPYVRHELIKELKPGLKTVYPDVYMGTADLYCYFYARGLQLLRRGGMLVFISSNKWFRANYGTKLREHIAKTCRVLSITDFGDLPLFETATAYPMIFVAQKDRVKEVTTIFTQVESLDPPYPDVRAVIAAYGKGLGPEATSGETWMVTGTTSAALVQKMSAKGVPLGEYVKGQIYYGIKTGLNKAFFIDSAKRAELIAEDPKSAEVIKPLVVGKDIRKWCAEPKDRWLIVTPVDVPIKRYPAILSHLKQWHTELEKRWDKGNHWWELRPCDYYAEFDNPKIIFPDIAKELRFAFSPRELYFTNSGYFIPIKDLYLLGILNSKPIQDFYLELARISHEEIAKGCLFLA